MIGQNTVTARDILRNYKKIFEQVKKTQQPTIVVSHNKPQVAIISLEKLDELENLRKKNSARALWEFSKRGRELLKDEKLPADLSERHDFYLWEEETDTK